ncbi:hypothetical protein K505DRAFT_362948 [Melanomma pulvis-pyrius CBS 109.77]|uniref:Uncharacterized protein n=1 Tax=Melanomma pulvis-pyrius CBS 109.77 TaxID=1314802 RepID=A0A6A6X994_9PLEO|nr:hypothetical protein K505DRAFT_362948 [Melanomma pulvis-pyrius CBS 109.77]
MACGIPNKIPFERSGARQMCSSVPKSSASDYQLNLRKRRLEKYRWSGELPRVLETKQSSSQRRPKTSIGAFDTIGTISWEPTIGVMSKIEGIKFIATAAYGSPELPEDISPSCKNNHVGKAVWQCLMAEALETGSFVPEPEPRIVRKGAESLQWPIESQRKGLSARKVVVLS